MATTELPEALAGARHLASSALPVQSSVALRAQRDPGSFRDPSGAVFHVDGRVFRRLNPAGAQRFRTLAATGLLDRLTERRALVGTWVAETPEVRELFPDAALVLEHERIPFVSHPYEWPFELLRAGALQYLDSLHLALDHGFAIKDATAYNTQFVGVAPVMIDVTSLEPHTDGTPWASYAQFCRMFLAPLMLQSLAGIPFQAWMRSSLEGIDPAALSRVLRMRHKLRRDVLLHIVLQSWLNRSAAAEGPATAAGARLPLKTIYKLAAKLQRSIASLERPRQGRSHWLAYEADCHYAPAAVAAKVAFVQGALAAARPRTVWDLGCNIGKYSLAASEHAGYVVAMDSDEQAVGALVERLHVGPVNVLPLVMDLANPSPGQGWGESERAGLSRRGPADFALALALLHHLAISANVPVSEIAGWLARHARAGVVEFVPLGDPMARRLLATRGEIGGYDEGAFRAALETHFNVDEVLPLPDSERVLYAFSARR